MMITLEHQWWPRIKIWELLLSSPPGLLPEVCGDKNSYHNSVNDQRRPCKWHRSISSNSNTFIHVILFSPQNKSHSYYCAIIFNAFCKWGNWGSVSDWLLYQGTGFCNWLWMLPLKKMKVKNVQKWTFQIRIGESEGRTKERKRFL